MSDINDKLVGLLRTFLTSESQDFSRLDAALTATQEVARLLLGEDGAYWLYNLKRFFRREPCFKWHPLVDNRILIDVPHTLVGQVMVKGFRVMVVRFHTRDHRTPPRFTWSDANQLGYTQLSKDEVAALMSHITPEEFYDMGLYWLCHTFFARGEGADESAFNYRQVELYSEVGCDKSRRIQADSRSSEEMSRVVLTGPGGYALRML